jgi:hypothetical protein
MPPFGASGRIGRPPHLSFPSRLRRSVREQGITSGEAQEIWLAEDSEYELDYGVNLMLIIDLMLRLIIFLYVLCFFLFLLLELI